MPDPISLAAGYFLLKTAFSMGMTLGEDVGPNKIGFELMKSAAGNFYSDILKFGGQKAWSGIASRLRSEYNSTNPLNHDLQKAIRKAQIEATLSACESCFDDLKIQDATFLEKLRNKLSLNEDERWLKNVVQTLTINLAEIKDKDYIPPTITDDIDVLKIADNRNYPLTDESVQSLVNSIKEQTILEIRFANPPNFSQNQIASSLEQKIYNGWTKEFQGETVSVDWYKLLCDRFNEEYKENSKVNAALQKAFFQDIKADTAKKFADFSEKHFAELGDKMLSKLESIEGKQDRLYNFVEIFKDENDRKLTEALKILRTSVSDINKFTEEKSKETQDVTIQVGEKVIEANRQTTETQTQEIIQEFKKFASQQNEEIQHKFEEALQKTANFRRNILAKRDLTIIEKLLGSRRFDSFDRIFGKLTAQEDFFVSLKRRYTERYFNKLDGRFEITLMASDDLESEVKREYTGIYEGHGQLNEAFEYMRNAFRDANRLLIVGEPGVGKTVLLLKFANDLSDKTVEKLNSRPELRLDDIKDPIPVIFNLASWSEDYKSFNDWLIAMLKTGEGLSESFADELLRGKKIFLLLDGLDELAKNETPETAAVIRAKCFDSIVGFLKGGQKAVICCRVNEYWQIRKDIGQEDAEQRRKMPEVFVKNLDINQIEDALQRASQTEVDRESALNILKLMKTENSGIFLKVLSIPFYFTTALEVFDSSILKERNIPANEQELKDHLVGKLIAEKLEISPPKPKKFKNKSSFKWLKWLAKNLKKKKEVTFELADLQPSDLKRVWVFRICYGIWMYILFSLLFCMGLLLVLPYQPEFNSMVDKFTEESSSRLLAFISSLLFYFIITLSFLAVTILPFTLIYSFRLRQISTEDINKFSLVPLTKLKTWRKILLSAFFYTFIITVFFTLIGLLFTLEIIEIWSLFGIEIFKLVIIERVVSYCRDVEKYATLKNAYQRLVSGMIYKIIKWSIVLLLIIFVNQSLWIIKGNNTSFLDNFWEKLFFLLLIALSLGIGTTAFSKHLILRFLLSISRTIPIRFASFLNYVTKATLLEKDGGFWRFRHQELQDYLAKLP